jgi:tRNA(fMet)-specific endonuclease VapC
MSYLLDTNTCVYAIKRWPGVIERLERVSPDDVAVSVVTLAELWFGARKSSKPVKTRASVDAFLAPIAILSFDPDAAEDYGEIRFDLECSGRPIGERGLLIAATARSRGLTVVTHNVEEFSRVSELGVEDWVSTPESAEDDA